MKVTVAVVCFFEETNIRPCIESIYSQDYSRENFEVLIIDGGSKDKTPEIVRELQRKYPSLRLEFEPYEGTASSRKKAIELAIYDFVAFTDADCEVPENWLSTLTLGFKRHAESTPKLCAVGGRNESPNFSHSFLQALPIALNSYLGSFTSIQGRVYQFDKEVSSLATLNVLYNKNAVVDAGNFDINMLADGEDADMNFRLKKKNYRFFYLCDSFVLHKYRPTLKTWAINMNRYGRARAKLLSKHGWAMWSLTYMLPMFFGAAMFLGLLTPINPYFSIPFFYFPILMLFSSWLGFKSRKPNLSLHVFNILVTTHFCYAFGMAKYFTGMKIKDKLEYQTE